MDDLRMAVYEAMKNDIGVMAEYGDNETALYAEIMEADDDIIKEYTETFLD